MFVEWVVYFVSFGRRTCRLRWVWFREGVQFTETILVIQLSILYVDSRWRESAARRSKRRSAIVVVTALRSWAAVFGSDGSRTKVAGRVPVRPAVPRFEAGSSRRRCRRRCRQPPLRSTPIGRRCQPEWVRRRTRPSPAPRLRLLKADFEDEPPNIVAPGDVDVYGDDTTAVDTAADGEGR